MRLLLVLAAGCAANAFALTIESDFEGASVSVVRTDDAAQSVRFMPGGDPKRGWPCWWEFRVSGLDTSKPLTLEIESSDLPMPQANGSPSNKPLAGDWAMPDRASYSTDGRSWMHTEPGRKSEGRMIYVIKADSPTLLVAWGPPYTPARASAFVRESAARSAAAEELELCKSREGRPVPMLRVSEGDLPTAQRFGVWVEARQHAWEAGSSWVCQGFAEWLLGDSPEAAWLRQHAETFIVPIMDVDNTATGNGGKEALPRDHNRDWANEPIYPEVAAAQKRIAEIHQKHGLDAYIDLHNPGANDGIFFFGPFAFERMTGLQQRNYKRWMELAAANITTPRPVEPKYRFATYVKTEEERGRMSSGWVRAHAGDFTISITLETGWNSPLMSIEGYSNIGAGLGRALAAYLAENPRRE